MRLTTIESERFGLALAVSLVIHLLLLVGSLLIPEMQGTPERPESPPIQVRFEPLTRPEPEPSVTPPPVVAPRSEPAPSPTSAQARSTPAAQPARQPAASPAAEQRVTEEFPEWTPEPAPSFQNTFGSQAQSTVEGGRLSDSAQADTRAQVNNTARDLGTPEETPVTVKSSGSTGAGGGFTDADLNRLDKALSAAKSESGGGSSPGGRIAGNVTVGSIDELGAVLGYRGADYTGLPKLSSEAQAELVRTGLPAVTVRVNFVISPLGRIEDLQTSAASRYPALDAFLSRYLPEVLSFDALPSDDRYADFWQQVSLSLSVESN